MGRELTELEQEFYAVQEPEVVVPETPEPVAEVVTETTEPVVVAEIPAEVITPPVVETVDPPYKSKKFIEVEDEAALYDKLDKKYRPTKMSADEKAIAFLKAQNPELNDDEIAFTAMSDYGIGAEPTSKDDNLTDEQLIALRKQDIARKKLISQADKHFQDEASQVALPDYDPLDLDPDYKSYREHVAAQKAEEVNKAQKITEINTSIETNAKTISEIVENVEIDIDESKLTIPVTFKFNKEKQDQLADFAKRYQPTQAEYDAFNNTQTGKFDYEGYLKSLAPMCFAKEIAKAGLRQGLTQDRGNFIEKELKNSTLRNNDVSQTAETKFDIVDHWKFG